MIYYSGNHLIYDHLCLAPIPANLIERARGVQWRQSVVIYMMLHTSSLYDTTPIHCTPPPTAPLCNEHPNLIERAVRGRGPVRQRDGLGGPVLCALCGL